MGKISDIWVRLGLKKDGFDKGMDDAVKKTEGMGGAFGRIKAGALAAWAAIGASVTAFVKDFVNHSQTMGDMWNQVTGQMKTVWSQFLTSLTNWDWEGFGQRVRDAMDATSQSILAHDAEFEVMNSIKLRKAAMAEELAQLQIVMRDTRRSYDERAKAAQDYLDRVKPLYDEEIRLRERQYRTDTAEYLKMAGVGATADNTELLRKFFTDIAPDEDLMAQLVEYQKKNLGQQYELSKSDLADIDKFYEQYGMRAAATLTTIASYYQSTNDDVANKVIDAIVAYDRSLAAMNEETRRIQNVQNSALAMTGTADIKVDASSVAPSVEDAMKEAAELMNEVTDTDIAAAVEHMEDVVADMKLDLSKPFDEAGADIAAAVEHWEEILASADLDIPPIKTPVLDAALADIYAQADEYQRQLDLIADMNVMLSDSIVQSMGNGLQALTDMMMGLEGADMKNVLAAFIAPLGDTMKQMGAMIMAEGVAMEAFKNSFKTPGAAIAAGAALMAIGSLVSSGLQKLTANPTGGGSSASYGGSSYGSSPALNYENTLTIEVVGKISGSDIEISGKKTRDHWNR